MKHALDSSARPKVTVGLMWHSIDSPNLGVAALTHAQLGLLREAADAARVDPTFILMGWAQDADSAGGSEFSAARQIDGRRLFGLDPAWRSALNKCDLVLDIGEGDSFSDIYGWKRLLYMLMTKFVASRGNRPLVLSPQTIGPFRGRVAAWAADRAMKRASLIVTRDGQSSAYVKSRNVRTTLLEATDVAFALPFQARRASGGAPSVGLNVSGLLWNGGYNGGNQFGLRADYRQTTLALLDGLVAAGAEIHLVSHVVTADRQAEDDLRACQAVAAQRPGTVVVPPFATPMAAKSWISGTEFFVGARMHACIAAFSSGVPCMPLAYSRKFAGLFGTLGYPHVADLTAEDGATVLRRTLDAYANRELLKGEVRAGRARADEKLDAYRKELASLLGSAGRG